METSMDFKAYKRMVRLQIARFRRERGFTQEGLSEEIGKGQQYITQIEGENSKTFPSIATLVAIADALQIPLFWLFYTDGLPLPFPEEVDADTKGKKL